MLVRCVVQREAKCEHSVKSLCWKFRVYEWCAQSLLKKKNVQYCDDDNNNIPKILTKKLLHPIRTKVCREKCSRGEWFINKYWIIDLFGENSYWKRVQSKNCCSNSSNKLDFLSTRCRWHQWTDRMKIGIHMASRRPVCEGNSTIEKTCSLYLSNKKFYRINYTVSAPFNVIRCRC